MAGLHPVTWSLGSWKGRRTASGHGGRGTFRRRSPQPGAAAGSGFPLSPEAPPLPAARPLPAHMTVTCWLTPPPLPRGGQAATCLHLTLGHDGPRTRERKQLRMAWFPTDGATLGAPHNHPAQDGSEQPPQRLAGSRTGCTRLQLGTPGRKPGRLPLQFRRPCSKSSF